MPLSHLFVPRGMHSRGIVARETLRRGQHDRIHLLENFPAPFEGDQMVLVQGLKQDGGVIKCSGGILERQIGKQALGFLGVNQWMVRLGGKQAQHVKPPEIILQS